jgi:predicted DNA-binding transcriptional regulator AlpA
VTLHRLPERDGEPDAAGMLPPVEAVDQLDINALPGFLARLAALQTAVAVRMCGARTPSATAPQGAPDNAPAARSLTAPEAAARLGISKQTLYRRAKSYPFARRVTGGPRGALRFDAVALERWLAHRRP